jgi:AcrR family transcriptional regulator
VNHIAPVRQLFLDRGFAATTVPDIAESAGVSVPTVYKVFGNKPRLAKAVFDFAIAGDDEPVPMVERERLARVRRETDPRKQLQLYGEHLTATAPRHVPIRLIILAAASTDPEAARVWQDLQHERLCGIAAADRRRRSLLHVGVPEGDGPVEPASGGGADSESEPVSRVNGERSRATRRSRGGHRRVVCTRRRRRGVRESRLQLGRRSTRP